MELKYGIKPAAEPDLKHIAVVQRTGIHSPGRSGARGLVRLR